MNLLDGGVLATSGAIVLGLLGIAMVLALIRLVLGPDLPNRVVALDLVVTISVGMMATYAVVTRETAVLDAAVIAALLAFLGTAAFANYLERGGQR